MGVRIVQINFGFTVAVNEYEAVCAEVAKALAEVEGLKWKAWLINEERHEAGGIYLFENETSAARYVNGPIVEALRGKPGIERVEIKIFNVLEGPSKLTRFVTVGTGRN